MKLLELRKVKEGKFLSFYIADYLNKNNKIKSYEFFSRNSNLTMEEFGNSGEAGVALIVFNEDKTKVMLTKEFRLACNSVVYNFAGGLIDSGETLTEAAIRELFEETGLEVIEILDESNPCFASEATSDEVMGIVVCRAKGNFKESTSFDEEIEPVWVSKEEAKQLLKSGVAMSVRVQIFLYCWVNMR